MDFDFRTSGLLSIRHLRFKRLWIAFGALLIACVLLGSVVSVPNTGVKVHDKVMHTLAYAALMGWFAQIYRHDLTRLLLVLGLISMGIGIEFVQGAVPSRQFEILDMLANTSGVVLAWALAYTWVGNILPWIESSFCRVIGAGQART
jgi:glycopeptide antibiotics resistance protein